MKRLLILSVASILAFYAGQAFGATENCNKAQPRKYASTNPPQKKSVAKAPTSRSTATNKRVR